MNKSQWFGFGGLVFSVGLFSMAVSFWQCGASHFCRENGYEGIKAQININLGVETSDSWSGKDNAQVNITGGQSSVYIPPPPPPRRGH